MAIMSKRLFCGAVLAVLLLAGAALSQEYRGRIQDTVMDSSRAAVPGATVTLLNIKTNISATKMTSEVGRYLFDLVDPGTYKLTVELQGFNKFELENISVPSRADLTLDAELRPGNITETVSVTAEASAMQF